MIESNIKQLLEETRFDFVSADNKAFIVAFDSAMHKRGWGLENNGHFKGYCWGRYMLIYCKLGVKSKKVAARIYLRDQGIVLRLYLNGMDKYQAFLESSPEHIKSVFTNNHGSCGHCGNEHDGKCKHRKIYTIDGNLYEKCDGAVFEFESPTVEKLQDYFNLLDKFYPVKKPKIIE